MNISEMKAGCELDARVAEKVMEWTLSQPEYVMGYLAHGGSMMRLYKGPGLPRKNRTTPSEEWSPSTDIAPAWEVWEKVFNEDYTIGKAETLDGIAGYEVQQYEHGVGGEPYVQVAWAETAPLAICLAALKAVEEEK